MKFASLLVTCGVLGAASIGLAPSALAQSEVPMRGAGKTRETLNAMQLKPFDHAVWSNLSSWTNGELPKAEELQGKVVMVITWASWYPVSHRAMKAAETVHAQYKDKGLVVLGVHNPRGWENAASNAKDLGITFPFAEDKDGKFRAALKGEQDPNIYFIDRAGQMRFAQVETSAISRAADILIKESAEDAGGILGKMKDKANAAEKEKWLTRDPSGFAPGEYPVVEFKEPDEDAYTAAKWPYLVGKVERDPILKTVKNKPPMINNWPEEDWTPAAPKTKGKLRVLYFVDPEDPPMLASIPTMNAINDQYRRDVIVVCSLFKNGSSAFTGNQNQPNNEEADKVRQRNKQYIKSILGSRSVNHFLNPTILTMDDTQIDFSTGGMVPRIYHSNQGYGIAMILSTDNRIRWIGNPFDPDLRQAIEKLVAVDPATAARRKAEDAKMKK